jgi:acetyltransferase-like isoleucine patch superfamily enzyme
MSTNARSRDRKWWYGLPGARALRAALRQLRLGMRDIDLRDRLPDASIAEGVVVRGIDRLTVGKGLILDHRAYINCRGGVWNKRGGYVTIGDNSEIGPYCALWGAGGITIGNNVHLGSHVSISAHEGRQVKPDDVDVWKPLDFEFAPVVIEDHVLVCSGTSIAPGVRIGHHSIIGCGSAVVKDIPPYSVAAGAPARVIRSSVAPATSAITA